MAGENPGHASARGDQWERIRGRLLIELGSATFNSWIKPLKLDVKSDGVVAIQAPTRFMRDWVNSHYSDRLTLHWRNEDAGISRVDVELGTGMAPPVGGAAEIKGSGTPQNEANEGEQAYDAEPKHETAMAPIAATVQQPSNEVGAPLDPRFTFENFVVGKSNELAYAVARRVAESSEVNFNPFFLYGGVGLGKTHLMHAIAHHIRQRDPSRRVLYLSAEKFMYEFVRALRFRDTMPFKQQFRTTDVLMIDDIQFFSGKDSTQEEFFHTFNALVEHHRQIIISADRSPPDLEGIEERIRSRLGWGLAADIHPADYELRLGILQSKAEQSANSVVPDTVLEFLAHRIVSNVRELEGALNRVMAYATLVGREVTVEMATEVLKDLLRANNRRITIDEIQRKVAEHYNIRLSEMLSARRARAVARPRQVAMYLAKQMTSRSLPEIGRRFGGRDHTTVMHAVKRIEELSAADAGLNEDIDLLRRMLGA